MYDLDIIEEKKNLAKLTSPEIAASISRLIALKFLQYSEEKKAVKEEENYGES